MSQSDQVVETVRKLGGITSLSQLNKTMADITRSWETRTPLASIRRIVQTDRRIRKIQPGVYALYGLLRMVCPHCGNRQFWAHDESAWDTYEIMDGAPIFIRTDHLDDFVPENLICKNCSEAVPPPKAVFDNN